MEPLGMIVVGASRGLLASGAALFLLVPLAVVTAGVFSSQVWWDLPLSRLALAGWTTLALVAPLSWRIMMGRRGAIQALASFMALGSLFLVVRSIAMRGTLQGVWTLTVMAACLGLLSWVRRELGRPFFDPGLGWFVGIPKALPGVQARLGSAGDGLSVRVARLGSEGAFVFSFAGSPPAELSLEVELALGERKVRLNGKVVRRFIHQGSGWGVGIMFGRPRPDQRKELGDFLNAIRSEGHAL
jgi:hypothetical protein